MVAGTSGRCGCGTWEPLRPGLRLDRKDPEKAMSMPAFVHERHSSKPDTMMSVRKTALLLIGGVLLASMMLVGCDKADDAGNRPASTTDADHPKVTREITTSTAVISGPDNGPPMPLRGIRGRPSCTTRLLASTWSPGKT